MFDCLCKKDGGNRDCLEIGDTTVSMLNEATTENVLPSFLHFSCINKSFGYSLFARCYGEPRTNCIEMGKVEMIVVSFGSILMVKTFLIKKRGFDDRQQ